MLAAGVLTALAVGRAKAKVTEQTDINKRTKLLKDPIVQDLLADQKLELTSQVRSENDQILEDVKTRSLEEISRLNAKIQLKEKRIAKLTSQEFRDYSTGYTAGQGSIRTTIRNVGTSLYGG